VSKDEPLSLLVPSTAGQQFEESGEKQTKPGIVSWSPPLPNWNPWTSCNIDEGPLATVISLFTCSLHSALYYCMLHLTHVTEADILHAPEVNKGRITVVLICINVIVCC